MTEQQRQECRGAKVRECRYSFCDHNSQFSIINSQFNRVCRATELWSVGTLGSTSASFVGAGTIDVVFCLNDMLALRQHVEEEMGGIVFRSAVVTVVVTAELVDGLHAGSASVNHLHKVQIALGCDGDANFDAAPDL